MWADVVNDDSYKWDAFLPFFQKSLTFTPPDNSKRAANVTPDYDLKAIGPRGGPLSVTFPNYDQLGPHECKICLLKSASNQLRAL